MRSRTLPFLLAVAALPVAAARLEPARLDAPPQVIAVESLDVAPHLDGDLGDWPQGDWTTVTVVPAVENDDKNRAGTFDVQLRAAVHDGRIYLAARWPDRRPDTRYRSWRWNDTRYRRGKELDDMFAVRLDLAGDYDSCMLSDAEYRVDVWAWSAGRSDPTGHAVDMWQQITTKLTENAAEYEGPSGKTVYITRRPDAGDPVFTNTRPKLKVHQGERLPGVESKAPPSGSAADVQAKGAWVDGHWQLEIGRDLVTGHADDAELVLGQRRTGAIAVFDRAAAEHKSVSGDLVFDLGALR